MAAVPGGGNRGGKSRVEAASSPCADGGGDAGHVALRDVDEIWGVAVMFVALVPVVEPVEMPTQRSEEPRRASANGLTELVKRLAGRRDAQPHFFRRCFRL